jgi:dynein heavy chain 2
LLRFLSSESEQLQWKAQGLPADGLFMENAAILQHGTLTPLVVDPGAQAAAWLMKRLGEGGGSTVEQITPQVSGACRFRAVH